MLPYRTNKELSDVIFRFGDRRVDWVDWLWADAILRVEQRRLRPSGFSTGLSVPLLSRQLVLRQRK